MSEREEEDMASRIGGGTGAARSSGAAPELHVIDGELRGRTFDIVTKREDGSVITYIACDVVAEYANKIAAAPDMFEALKGAIGALEFSRDYHSDLGNEEQAFAQDKLDAALKALAKAQGQV